MKPSPFTDLYEAALHAYNSAGTPDSLCQLGLVLQRYQNHEELDNLIHVIGSTNGPADHELFTRIWERNHKPKTFFTCIAKFILRNPKP